MRRTIQFGIFVATTAVLVTTAYAAEPELPNVARASNSCVSSPVNVPEPPAVSEGKNTPQLKDLPPERLGFSVNCDQPINSLSLKGGDDFVTHVFVLSQRFDFVTFDPTDKLPPPGTDGELEMLARERDPDPQTGMYYRARYYSPAIGRFLSEDPVSGGGAPLITNPYSYSMDNLHGKDAWYSNHLAASNLAASRTQFQWQGWIVHLSVKDYGKTVFLTFTKNQTGVNPYGLLPLLISTPPLEAIGIDCASNPPRAGPTTGIVLTDPFGFKKPKLLASEYQMPSECCLPRPRHSFGMRQISGASARMVFVTFTNIELTHRPILASTPLITPLRT